MKKSFVPPIGVKPKCIRDEERIIELSAAMKRFIDAHYPIPEEITEEYNTLTFNLEKEGCPTDGGF